MEVIIKIIAKEFSVSVADLLIDCRREDVCLARHTFCLMALQSGNRVTDISRFLSKSHGSIVHSLKVLDSLREDDFDLRNKIKKVRSTLNLKKTTE